LGREDVRNGRSSGQRVGGEKERGGERLLDEDWQFFGCITMGRVGGEADLRVTT